MKHKRALVAAGLACTIVPLVLVGVSLATPSAKPSKATTINLDFSFSDAHAKLDHGASGLSTGDTETFSGPILLDNKRIGFGMGHCVVAHPGKPLAQCFVTFYLPKGQISITGPNYFNRPFNQGITGGTGEFRSARGEVRVAPVANGEGWKLKLELIRKSK